jgi:hypothetical protein
MGRIADMDRPPMVYDPDFVVTADPSTSHGTCCPGLRVDSTLCGGDATR